jgi:hypothetical protein
MDSPTRYQYHNALDMRLIFLCSLLSRSPPVVSASLLFRSRLYTSLSPPYMPCGFVTSVRERRNQRLRLGLEQELISLQIAISMITRLTRSHNCWCRSWFLRMKDRPGASDRGGLVGSYQLAGLPNLNPCPAPKCLLHSLQGGM